MADERRPSIGTRETRFNPADRDEGREDMGDAFRKILDVHSSHRTFAGRHPGRHQPLLAETTARADILARFAAITW